MRTLIQDDPFISQNAGKPWLETGRWSCCWIDCPAAGEPPFVTAYRLRFTLQRRQTIRAHVTADERYELFLDGERIGRGPERGAPHHWFYETYDFDFPVGEHCLVAKVWSMGDEHAGIAQMSAHPGFLFAPEGDWTAVFGTGHAAWEAKPVAGYSFPGKEPAHWRSAMMQIDGSTYPWGVEAGQGEGWQPVRKRHPGVGRLVDWEFYKQHVLYPAMLTAQIEQPAPPGTVRHAAAVPSVMTADIPVHAVHHLPDEAALWTAMLEERSEVTIPPQTTRRVIIDLNNYFCGYIEVVVSGGSGGLVRVFRAESLYHTPDIWQTHDKGYRGEVEGKYFVGRGDTFLTAGGAKRHYNPLWWEAGRYLEVVVQTGSEAMTLHRLNLRETRYPLEMESAFAASEPRLTAIMPMLVRGVQMNAHETYTDCPYYEELMYAGDTRLEMLLTYVMTRDDHLPRKALTMFDASRQPNGLTQSRYPSRQLQIIAPFCIWWVGMVYDYAVWRDTQYAATFLPGVRATLESFARWMRPDGLLGSPDGWNTLDWVPNWEAGIPPDGVSGVSGLINWQFVYGLSLAAQLEGWFGDRYLSHRCLAWAAGLVTSLERFWDEERGLYADDLEKQHFSEHTQCMALLSGMVRDNARAARIADGLLTAPDLERATIYFSHYLFETLRQLKRTDVLLERMSLWYDLLDKDLKTPVESPEPTRSDCHAWGSHPLYHYFATILGIRPGGFGFGSVLIEPQLGRLTHASGTLVHPNGGVIQVEFRMEGDTLHGRISLPPGVMGIFIDETRRIEIAAGGSLEF